MHFENYTIRFPLAPCNHVSVCMCLYRHFFTCFFLLKETVIRDLMILLKRTNFYEKACWKEKKGNSASGPLILSPARSETVLMGREVPLSSVFLNLKIIRRSTRRETSRYNANYGCHNERMGTWLWRQLEINSEMFWDLQQGCNHNTGFDIKALNDDKQWSIRRTNKEMINHPSGITRLQRFWLYDINELFKRYECLSNQNRKYCSMLWYWFHCIDVCKCIYTHRCAHTYSWQAKRIWMSNHLEQLHVKHLFLKPKITGTDMYHWLCNSSDSRVFNYLVTADD